MATTTRPTRISARDVNIEKILDTHVIGKDYKFADALSIEEIIRNTDSQSRLRSADSKMVNQFAEAMKNGEQFPPVIVWQTPDNGAYLCEGNTRVEASVKLKRTTIPAYVVNLSTINEAIYLSAVFNGKNGVRLNGDEIRRAVIAASSITPNPPSTAQLARDYGISPSQIGRMQAEVAAEKRMTDMGIAGIDGLTNQTRARLNKIALDAPFRAATELAVDSAMPAADVKELVDEVIAASSESAQVNKINAARAVRSEDIKAIAAGRKTAGTPVTELRRATSQLLKLMTAYPNINSWLPHDAHQIRTWTPRVTQLAEFLDVLQAEYGQALEALPEEVSTDAAPDADTDTEHDAA